MPFKWTPGLVGVEDDCSAYDILREIPGSAFKWTHEGTNGTFGAWSTCLLSLLTGWRWRCVV